MNTNLIPIGALAFTVLLQAVAYAWFMGALTNRVVQLERIAEHMEQYRDEAISQGKKLSALEAFVEDLMNKPR